MRKAFLLITFFGLTPLVILASAILLTWISYTNGSSQNHFFTLGVATKIPAPAYAALPNTQPQLTGSVTAADARLGKLQAFFRLHNSILEKYAGIIIAQADKYNIDWTLLPAIAMQESNGCQRIVKNSFNCFGWGITKKKITKFSNYEVAITTITKLFAKNYVNKGLNTPEEIGRVYNPSNTNDWVAKVNYFQDQIQNEPIIAYLTNL